MDTIEAELAGIIAHPLPGLFAMYRRIKSRPDQAQKTALIVRQVRSIGEAISDIGGAQAIIRFIGAMEVTHGPHMAEFLARRWEHFACLPKLVARED